jgi:hypothetical protein
MKPYKIEIKASGLEAEEVSKTEKSAVKPAIRYFTFKF